MIAQLSHSSPYDFEIVNRMSTCGAYVNSLVIAPRREPEMGAEKRDYSRDVRSPLTRDGVDGENSRLLLLLRG